MAVDADEPPAIAAFVLPELTEYLFPSLDAPLPGDTEPAIPLPAPGTSEPPVLPPPFPRPPPLGP